ncbi:M23 family metallopeptidase [Niallia sp. FSL R7-0271]|uniref:M23 family metallopeptidase n=1 Tax=Niallia sp. FSL R7-0271 TaxID=2921678 RepID=UPI0030F93528
MSSRADEIRRRIEKRKKERERMQKNVERRVLWNDEEESGDHNTFYFENDKKEDDFHPLFRKDLFLLKILGAAVLFLIVAIVVRNQSPSFQKAETSIRQAMNQEFNFAFVSNWYEDQFGKPLAFLPSTAEDDSTGEEQLQQYALSASGKILEDFADTGQRVAIETGIDTSVQALNEGTVTFIGEKEGFGNTVVIQHSDKSESWYGNLEEVDVNIYQSVKKGSKVGLASGYGTNETLGLFYFAIKKDNDFIDPIQVIEFE